MKIVPLKGSLSATELKAIDRFRLKSGKNPFLCLNDHVMLLLTPGRPVDALMAEAKSLMAANLAGRPSLFVHTFADQKRMVRTIKDLCILETEPGAFYGALLQEGLAACRCGTAVALVLPGAEDEALAA